MCKKPFQSLGGRICPACLERIDRDFIKVRDYIYENKHASVDKVSEETEVPKQIIMHLLKEGRLIIDDPDGEGLLHCEVCKKPINTGRMCDSCKDKVKSKMQHSMDTKKPSVAANKDEPNFKASAKLQS